MNISVVIPAYNREKTIERALMSVLRQTVLPYEIIVVDDGSVDSTAEIVRKIRGGNSLVRLLRLKRNRGAQAARNCGIKAAKGEWIAFLDSDDEFLEHSLEIYCETVRNNPGYDVYYGDYYANKKGKVHYKNCRMKGRDGDFSEDILYRPKVLFPGMLVHRKALEDIGLLDENVPAFQEWDTNIRLSRNHRYYYIQKPLFIYYTMYGGETISTQKKRDAKGFWYVVMTHQDLFFKNGVEGVIYYYAGMQGRYRRYGDKRQYYYAFMSEIAQMAAQSKILGGLYFRVIKMCWGRRNIGNDRNKGFHTGKRTVIKRQ